MSYAFSAKNRPDVEPDQPIGPGGGETIGGGGDDDDEGIPVPEIVTFQLSGSRVMPFVPFNLTLTASKPGDYAGSLYIFFGDGGTMSWKRLKEGSWNGGVKRMELGCETVNAEANSARVSFHINPEYPYTTSLPYSVGSMSVSMPGAMFSEQTYNFTVTYSGGSKCYARSLSQMGAKLKLEGLNGDTWSGSGLTLTLGEFKGGVQKGTITIAAGFTGTKVRLCCTYAGRQTCAEATVAKEENIVFHAPSMLHIYGIYKNLTITRSAK